MKKIIITGGPTNEPIDEIMKITNMSTGGMAVQLGDHFCEAGYDVVLILNNSVRAVEHEHMRIVRIETTEDLLKAIEKEAQADDTDAIIHAAAVGDYKSDFAFLLEDMADEIYSKRGEIKSEEDVLAILQNPHSKIDSSAKISSYQKGLTVKLDLTPKIISYLRFWFPESLLIGCKLLDGVEKGELFDAASALCNKNRMDYILANDLSDLRAGRRERYLINEDGFTEMVLDDYEAIFHFVDEKLENR